MLLEVRNGRNYLFHIYFAMTKHILLGDATNCFAKRETYLPLKIVSHEGFPMSWRRWWLCKNWTYEVHMLGLKLA